MMKRRKSLSYRKIEANSSGPDLSVAVQQQGRQLQMYNIMT